MRKSSDAQCSIDASKEIDSEETGTEVESNGVKNLILANAKFQIEKFATSNDSFFVSM